MSGQPATTTVTAVYRAGKIIAGGAPCYRCGTATMTQERADPFGKAEGFRWVCADCMAVPFGLSVQS